MALETVSASQASFSAKLSFRFLALTAARSGEARPATWDEIDMQERLWRIPSERMKAGVEHRVPLSEQALEILAQASVLRDESGLIFPSPLKPGSPMSDMTLTKILRSTGLADRATVHGFRSSFKNWTLEQTLGSLRSGPCPHPRHFNRTSLCPLRPVRASPRLDATLGGLLDRLTSSRRA